MLMGGDGFKRAAQSGAGNRIGGGARSDEAHISVGVEKGAHRIRRLGADPVRPIAGGGPAIVGDQGFQRLGTGGGGIVRGEGVGSGAHGFSLENQA